MNIEMLNQVAEWLEAGAPKKAGIDAFNMNYFFEPETECGTVCCIAGAVVQFNRENTGQPVFSGNNLPEGVWHYFENTAREILGLSVEEASKLFFAGGVSNFAILDQVTPTKAASVIRHLIKTGKVDWSVAGYR